MPWRPPQSVRPIAVALVYRGADVLVMAVKDDVGSIKGWRPLGGAIEFGESPLSAPKDIRDAVLRRLEPSLRERRRAVEEAARKVSS